MMKPVLKYPPGSNWLYFRMYGGPQALEQWITGPFMLFLENWRNSSRVKIFHFVHYLDPEYHLRIRFLLSEPADAGILMNEMQLSCHEMLVEDLIWKLELGTYEPEYDRYGVERMSLVESWFDLDSQYWLKEIIRLAGDEEPAIWKSAIRSIDAFFNDFGACIDDKISLVIRLKESSALLFGLTKAMKGQLDAKYRELAGVLGPMMESHDSEPDLHLLKRSADAYTTILKLRETFAGSSSLFESELLPNLIHMSMNRAFRTRHRMQELVVYDFLSRYYQSFRARAKERDTKRVTREPEERI